MKLKFFFSLLFIIFWTNALHAESPAICPLQKEIKSEEVASLEAFKRIAILEDGRIKPLDTYAQNVLLRLSGKRTFDRHPALRWLARLLFAPEATIDDKVFLVNNPEIPMALGIGPDERRRYSFAQLEPGYQKLHELSFKANAIDKKSRTVLEEEIIRLDSNIRLYADISHSFQFAFPHPDFGVQNTFLKEKLGLPQDEEQFSFLDIALRADSIAQFTKALETKNINQWSSEERETMRLVNNLYEWSRHYQNSPLGIVPAYDSQKEEWLSPWDAIDAGFQSAIGRREIMSLRNLAAAYWKGKQLEFDLAARSFRESVKARAHGKIIRRSLKKIDLEILYNRLNFFLWAKFFYALAFLVFLFSLPSGKSRLRRFAFFLVIAGFLLHALALGMRVVLSARPPVTNLYETFIFVALIGCLVGMIVEMVNRQWLGIVVASVCGFVFLTIAGKFAAEGDTFRMLVAVLNSNFWLGTHVVSITTGYAGVCTAGILGHVYILQGLARPKERRLLDTTYKNILGVLGFGLTMTFLGTNLGGIWADQSWGRFWGWDPKENGAMLIVLWCAIIFHAKVGRMIGPLGVAVGSILGIIVVMWAWFGVNLLSVGLHSYGFTSGVAAGLIVYVALELMFLLVTVPMVKRKLIW